MTAVDETGLVLCLDLLRKVHSSPMVAARANYRIVHHENLKGIGSGTSSLPIAPAPEMNCTYHIGLGLPHTRRHKISSDSINPRRKAVRAGPASSFPAAPLGVVPADLHRKPLVVIDGSNVAFALREVVSNPQWSPHGILLALQVRTRAVIKALSIQRLDLGWAVFVLLPGVTSTHSLAKPFVIRDCNTKASWSLPARLLRTVFRTSRDRRRCVRASTSCGQHVFAQR